MAARILLIGGTRFLGSQIASLFVEHGDEVYEMNRGTRPPLPGAAGRIICDKNDRAAFAAALTRRPWDVIIDTILNDEDLVFAVDALGSWKARFIHTGSLGVYGAASQIPAVESMPLGESDGPDVVFNAKLKQDRVMMSAFHERGFPATVLRMSYIYGPGDLLLDGWGGRSPEFFRLMRDGHSLPLPGDGRALLHPGHVRDLGRAFLLAAGCPAAVGQIYNIGGPYALMLKDYAALIARAMGVELRLEYASVAGIQKRFPACTDERGMRFVTQHMCASISKAERELGWRPEIPLETGIRETIAWMKQTGIV